MHHVHPLDGLRGAFVVMVQRGAEDGQAVKLVVGGDEIDAVAGGVLVVDCGGEVLRLGPGGGEGDEAFGFCGWRVSAEDGFGRVFIGRTGEEVTP